MLRLTVGKRSIASPFRLAHAAYGSLALRSLLTVCDAEDSTVDSRDLHVGDSAQSIFWQGTLHDPTIVPQHHSVRSLGYQHFFTEDSVEDYFSDSDGCLRVRYEALDWLSDLNGLHLKFPVLELRRHKSWLSHAIRQSKKDECQSRERGQSHYGIRPIVVTMPPKGPRKPFGSYRNILPDGVTTYAAIPNRSASAISVGEKTSPPPALPGWLW